MGDVACVAFDRDNTGAYELDVVEHENQYLKIFPTARALSPLQFGCRDSNFLSQVEPISEGSKCPEQGCMINDSRLDLQSSGNSGSGGWWLT